MVPEGRFFERTRRRSEVEDRKRVGGDGGGKYRFAVGVSTDPSDGVVGFQAVNSALDRIVRKPSLAFISISKKRKNRESILSSMVQVLGNIPLIGVEVADPLLTREGVHEGGVAVALWCADEDMEIETHRVTLKGATSESIRTDLLKIFQTQSSKRYLNVIGVVPYTVEGVGETVERAFLSLSEYVDLGLMGIVGGTSPSPWSVIHGGEFLSNYFALITIRTDVPFGMFLAYGFHPLVPMEITVVDGRFIVELDNSPATGVLLDLLLSRGVSGADIKDRARLLKILSRFQLAVSDPAAAGRFKTVLIRDIGRRGIETNVELKVGDTVWLMEANTTEMVKSTMKAFNMTQFDLKGSKAAGLLFFENHLRISALGDKLKANLEGLKKSSPLPFLGVPSSQELVIHHRILSGLHSGVAAGVVLANGSVQP
ncbi:MAG: hypothetical protein GXO39_09530 [Thermotogae bacterium]|nr:hypothetical protein [Thermotogota bacterium]